MEATGLTMNLTHAKNAEEDGASNCPISVVSHHANVERIHEVSIGDANHLTAWSKGGEMDRARCEILFIPYNRFQGYQK